MIRFRRLCLMLTVAGLLCSMQAWAQQYIYVANYTQLQLSRYTIDGTPTPAEGNTGSKFNKFVMQYPAGVAVSPTDGALYLSGLSHDYIWKVNPSTGGLFTTWFDSTSGMSSPECITFGPDGSLFVSNQGTNQVLRFTAAGNPSPSTGKTGAVFAEVNTPAGTVVGPDGNLYVSSQGDNSVKVYNAATGVSVREITGSMDVPMATPSGLTFGPDGNLYVGNFGGDNVLRFNGITGEFIDVYTSRGIDGPGCLQFGPDGNLYISAWYDRAIQKYNVTTGDTSTVVNCGSEGYNPYYFTIFSPPSVPVSVSGHVTLSDFDTANLWMMSLGIEFIKNGNVMKRTKASIDNNGDYSTGTVQLEPGSYDLGIKAGQFLRVLVPNVSVTENTTLDPIILFNGDLDGSNSVSTADFSILSGNFNKIGDQ